MNKRTLGPAFLPVASGPGNATFSFLDYPGQWAVHTSADPAGITTSFTKGQDTPEPMLLAAGEFLRKREGNPVG
ncbi:hypothetical protein [Cereibacter changlensis]|uniref:hypothetical protein n=1 Tax=Cereibacter changlensis TaxID=402884 RepID=UPI00403464A2